MAGFLQTLFGSPDQTQALGLLGSYLMSGQGPQGFLAANQHLAGAEDRKLKRGLLEAQRAETLAQAEERRMIAAARQAEMERQAGIQRGLPGLFTKPGMTGGAAVPQTFGGSDVPMFSAPMGVTPMRSTPGGFDMQRALTELRMKPEEAKAYWELSQAGKPKVARTMEVMRNGKPTMIQLDESGQEIGQGYDQWKAPVMQDLGGTVGAIDPVTLRPLGSFGKTMTPDGRDASARGWQALTETKRHNQATEANHGAANNILSQGNIIKTETDLRKEFADRPEFKRYAAAYPSYQAIVDASKSSNPQANINLIYGLAKLYDPDSVVREGEYATIANSQAIPEWLKGAAQNLAGKGKLTEETKRQILSEAKNRILVYQNEYDKATGAYEGIAQQRGASPQNIITKVGRSVGNQLPQNASASTLVRGLRYELPDGRIGVWDGQGFKVE